LASGGLILNSFFEGGGQKFHWGRRGRGPPAPLEPPLRLLLNMNVKY